MSLDIILEASKRVLTETDFENEIVTVYPWW